MKPKEITQIIEKEINGDWSITNWHNCDLKQCLIRPKKRQVNFGEGIKEIWIVLEEDTEMLDRHKVYFDEKTKKFGIVIHSDPFGFACNSHDSFLAAFNSM